MIRLVVNADDLGLHPELDEGILRAHREGIVTSATVLVTGPGAQGAIAAANAQGLALGVHLALCTRLPPAAAPERVRTVAPGGRLRAAWPAFVKAWALRQVDPEELEAELRAQVARARALGARVDHLDAHQHLHVLPGVRARVAAIARDERLPLRWPSETPRTAWLRRPGPAVKSALLSGLAAVARPAGVATVRGIGLHEAGALDEAALLGLIDGLGDGDWELGCHPGARPVVVPEDPRWTYGWDRELAALTSGRVRTRLAERAIGLTTYGALFASA